MREICGWKDLKQYLLRVEAEQKRKPFDCSKLIVLPEDVEYKAEVGSFPELYLKGSLMCHSLAFVSNGGHSRCAINSEIELTEVGELEVLCNSLECGYLTIKIKRFRKPNQE